MNRHERRAATKRENENWDSYVNDKAVQDNIVESWLCVDCGINTHPGTQSGPEVRIAFALGAEALTTTYSSECEVYDVRDLVWKQAGMRPWSGCLCIGCLERRIGRQLKSKDFSSHDRKVWAELPCTERLLNRRGYATIRFRTKDGEEEGIVDKDVAAKIAAVTPAGELPWVTAVDE